jgi:hypothetical protein
VLVDLEVESIAQARCGKRDQISFSIVMSDEFAEMIHFYLFFIRLPKCISKQHINPHIIIFYTLLTGARNENSPKTSEYSWL